MQNSNNIRAYHRRKEEEIALSVKKKMPQSLVRIADVSVFISTQRKHTAEEAFTLCVHAMSCLCFYMAIQPSEEIEGHMHEALYRAIKKYYNVTVELKRGGLT